MQAHTFTAAHLDPFGLEVQLPNPNPAHPRSSKSRNIENRKKKKKKKGKRKKKKFDSCMDGTAGGTSHLSCHSLIF